MKQILSLMLMIVSIQTMAQVKIGSPGIPNSNAVLELDGGTTKGFLLPRITTTDMNGAGFSSAPNGLLIYNSTDGFLYIRKNAVWQKVTDATNNGSFTLPYSGSAATAAGLSVFKIQNTNAGTAIAGEALGGGYGVYGYSNTDAGGFFSSSTGPALITGTGNVGIGITPTLGKLVVRGTVGAVAAMFGDNTSGVAVESNYPGIGFNSYYNAGRRAISTGFGSLVGQDPLTGRFYIASSAASVTGQGTAMALADRLVINANGNIGVQGNTNPQSPLSFANFVGEKINFYDVSASSNYGIGIQGAQLQLYTGSSGDAISFGYGSSAAFTEKVRMQNGYTVLYNGRLQFSGQLSAGNTQGIEFTNLAGTATKNFIGVYDDNNIGYFGFGGVGWGFLWDGSDGTLRLGTTQKATGYLMNVGGKIMAEEVRVQLRASWPDYVFNKDYKLQSLAEVENYIAINNHLPNVPAAAELEKSGIALGEMQSKMMEKIEEMTLYIIDLQKQIDVLKSKGINK